ncbi:MAG: ribonuclease E/G [Lachnospiraceae bacterium]|nr:ribonuclease E/G [Lachnospiraceae bacterium]
MNQYIICRMRDAVFSFLIHDEKAVEIHCDREENASLLGNIYVGRVRDIARNIGAAFVEIAPDTVCYLALDEIQNPIYTKKGSSPKLQMGDELLVQVSREAIKTKYPSVSTNLTFHGKYLLLTTGRTQISASSKLAAEEKKRLTAFVRELDGQQEGRTYGWLLRTNAGGADSDTLRRDMDRLLALYQKTVTDGAHRVCYSCLLAAPHTWISRLSDLYESAAERFVTDDPAIWEEAKEYLSACQPEDLSRLFFYQDALQPLCKKYSLERQLEHALSEHVWLNCGGYLVLQPTEALTVIDVNSGKYEGSAKNRQKAFFKINQEAAREAARQIRLRNISGIIIIDFINMDSADDKEALLRYLDSQLRQDPIRTILVDMTGLSLVEITRMKKEKPLYAQVHAASEHLLA